MIPAKTEIKRWSMQKILDNGLIQTIYESATDLLASIGVKFDMDAAVELFEKHGAKTKGRTVYFSPKLLEKILSRMPKHNHVPAGKKRLVAASPFSNSPMVLDDATGKCRRGTIEDAIQMYQLAETANLYESINPGIADPAGCDGDDLYLAQIAMLLKYSDKWPSLGMRATPSNTRNGDIYASAKKAIRLIKEVKEDDQNPVMGQGICPLAPMAYDEESLINLKVLVEEKQEITLFPCTLSFMTGPESLLGVVIHDLALGLAGAAYIQLLKPGTSVGFSNFSTMTDMTNMQPVYASPEYLFVQIMFYEVCRHLEMNAVLCGCLADGVRNDYQTGFESCLTAIAPFTKTDVDQVWCYPGHMGAFSVGSFTKMIFDEEMIINCNRILQGLDLSMDPLLKDKLEKSIEAKSFLTIGDVEIYRKEQRVTRIFDKRGLESAGAPGRNPTHTNAEKEIQRRLSEYELPKRSPAQKRLLEKYLPSRCKY